MFGESKEKFIRQNDIEGQQWTDDPLNETVMESFNMDQEFQEGDFTESGIYIKKKDMLDFHDSWLKDISKKEIENVTKY